MDQTTTVIILAAGLGTRMVSSKAKVLHEVAGLPLVRHVVDAALKLTSPENVVVVVGHQAEQVRQVLHDSGVRFVLQSEQKGTGHALLQCSQSVSSGAGETLVVYGDCPLLKEDTLRKLKAFRGSTEAAGTLITTTLENPTGYGRILLTGTGEVRAIVEEKVATVEQKAVRLINSGVYCFESEPLWRLLPLIQPNPVSREYYLTDIVEIFNANGLRFTAMIHENGSELLGINNRVELVAADRILREQKAEQLLLAGVTIYDRSSVSIDSPVTVGKDTIIQAGAHLLGRTTVGEECRIGVGAIIQNSILGNGVEIGPYTVVNESTIEDRASVGPFARLRLGNHVGEGSHIGNFVELKKASLGAGVKAGHLAYLGDTNIGAATNIGAGTITCNYDGEQKHKTEIAQNAFIGSNSTLVAPVSVGEGAYIAAGSVITEAVPPDALGIGRGRQAVKEGWAKLRREKKRKEKGI